MGNSNEVVNESITSAVDVLTLAVTKITKLISDGSPVETINNAIKKFVEDHRKLYVATRSVLAIDQYVSNDTKGASYMGSMYSSLVNSSPSNTAAQLTKFYDYAKTEDSKLNRAIEYFDNVVTNDLKISKNGIEGYGLVVELKKHIRNIRKMAMEYVKNNAGKMRKKVPTKSEPVTEEYDIIKEVSKLVERGLLDNFMESLTESSSKPVPINYFAIVDGVISIDGKKHRNVKSTVVTSATDPVAAFKNIKNSVGKSVTKINTAIKKEKAKLTITNIEQLKIYSDFNEIKKKNIGNLVGSEYVSRGFIILDGVLGHGNVGKEPIHYPLGHTFLNKSSITRYLKKNVT